MTDFDKGFQRLENAMGRSPREYPVGFFLQDIEPYPDAPGGFLWYQSDVELLNAIKNDLFSVFDRDMDANEIKSQLSNIATSVPSKPTLGESLRNRLNDVLAEANETIEFLGTFEQLCQGTGEWAANIRKQYREYADDDADDLSADVLRDPIRSSEIDDFAEYITNFPI